MPPRDEPTVTIPVSLLADMQETATKAATSGAKVSGVLSRIADLLTEVRDELRLAREDRVRLHALSEEAIAHRIQQARESAAADARAEAPVRLAFWQGAAETLSSQKGKAAVGVVVLTALGVLAAEFQYLVGLIGSWSP